MMDEKEIDYWMKEYPDLTRDDIIEILEFYENKNEDPEG